jgi:hypothetical protein
MMSHSLCTHAVMLTGFNLVSTTPRFHPPPSLPVGASAHVNFAVGHFTLHIFFCFRLPLRFLASFSFST